MGGVVAVCAPPAGTPGPGDRRDAGQFVQFQGRAAGLGDDRQQAGPGGGLQDLVARTNLRGGDRHGRQLRRRGELVKSDLLLAATGVGEGEGVDAAQQRRDLRRRILEAGDLGAETPKLQDDGQLMAS